MRAVALADETVQKKITTSFVPLKIKIAPGTETFPVDWPALKKWALVYRSMGGPDCQGITACAMVRRCR